MNHLNDRYSYHTPPQTLRESEGLIFNKHMTHNCKNFNKCGNTVERIATIRKDNFYICFDCKKENTSKYYKIKKENPERSRIHRLHCQNMIDYWSKKLKSLK